MIVPRECKPWEAVPSYWLLIAVQTESLVEKRGKESQGLCGFVDGSPSRNAGEIGLYTRPFD